METFCLPWHEIQDRFTSSELILMGWRSAEQSYQWKKKMKQAEEGAPIKGTKGKGIRKHYSDAMGPERAPDKYFTQEVKRDKRGRIISEPGDFDLSNVTGEEARSYFERVLHIPMPPGISKIRYDDETSQQIRAAYGKKNQP